MSTASGTATSATSEFRVEAGKWMYLVGSYDDKTDRISVSVCDPLFDGSPFEDPVQPIDKGYATYTSPRFADGPLRLGSGLFAGSHVDRWRGEVDNVRVWNGQKLDADDAKLRKLCGGAQMFSTVPGADENDPTIP